MWLISVVDLRMFMTLSLRDFMVKLSKGDCKML